MDYISLTAHDPLDRLTLLAYGGEYEFDTAYITCDDDYARVRVSRSRYETADPRPPMNPVGADIVASTKAALAYTGRVDHADYVEVHGVEYFELRCTPVRRHDR